MNIQYVTVFCGASASNNPNHVKAAYQFGAYLAQQNIGIVFGGGAVGMMGAVADGASDHGGEVIGVIPQFLIDREMAHPKVSKMHVVETMHERKALLESLGDAIVMLPGGAGTMEEFFEVFTWGQLGLHQKPIGILNCGNFFTPLMELINHLIDTQFLEARYRDLLFIENEPHQLMQSFQSFEPVQVRSYDDIKD